MSPVRTLASALAGALPDGFVAVPIRADDAEDIAAVTGLMRGAEQAATGRASVNTDEVRDELAGPECGWEQGAALIHRASADGPVVGAAIIFDGLAEGRGFLLDPYVALGDPDAPLLIDALVGGLLAEGQARQAALAADQTAPGDDSASPVAKAGCYANEALAPTAYRAHGFEEVRRFWRMRIDHDPRRVWNGPSNGRSHTHRAAEVADALATVPEGYLLRAFRADDESEWLALYELGQTAFEDHWDAARQPYEGWRAQMDGITEDPTQWHVVAQDDALVGYARGNDRYAAEGWGYVASIGVDRAHRGRGLARALLLTRFADDLARGRGTTTLHVDSSSPTGATRLYEGVGMRVEQEIIAFHRPLLD